MIEKLNWDSAFFGYSVGRIVLSENITDQILPSKRDFGDYKLVYAFSDKELPHEYDNYLVARRVHFYKKLSGMKKQVVVTPFIPNHDSYEELMRLALNSGVLSRFRVDNNFKNKEYQRLYKQWVDKSLGDPKSHLLVVRSEKHVEGFITFEFMDSGLTKFGLIAVDKNVQRKGLGSLLIKMAENESVDARKYEVQVTTHHENKSAMVLLNNNGYQKISSSFVYHFWNK
jgi:dTDP-4-amino-4,6-dideoxy-D-galactose acyltransferase